MPVEGISDANHSSTLGPEQSWLLESDGQVSGAVTQGALLHCFLLPVGVGRFAKPPLSRVWWSVPVILAPGRRGQAERELKVTLKYSTQGQGGLPKTLFQNQTNKTSEPKM